jgi:hypothetical protein
MVVPVQNIVEQVDLTSDDVLLPLYECVVNSIISLQKSSLPVNKRKIQIQIERGGYAMNPTFYDVKTINSFKIIDNGDGFNLANFQSFETPFSQVNKDFGCKGIGRFTVLAAYNELSIDSNFYENGKWKNRVFKFTRDNKIENIYYGDSQEAGYKTVVEASNCYNPVILEGSAKSLREIAESIMHHCLIYYLSGSLPLIEVFDRSSNEIEIINELFAKVSKDKEREFELCGDIFKIFITKTEKEGNRKNNYLYYCANSRTFGYGRNLKNVNSIFSYPIFLHNKNYLFDIYLVSDFLDRKVFKTRNGFNIPKESKSSMFGNLGSITMQDIDREVSSIIEEEYEEFVKAAKAKSISRTKAYISEKAPRYRSFLKNNDVLSSIPPNLTDDKLEEHLYKLSFNARKSVEQNIDKFIKNKIVSEEAIAGIINDIKEKTAYDVDSLADYMTRRRAIISLFDKFLDADDKGTYKLEEDVHNLIFPLGITNNELNYENHNLWLLDERFVTYKFIASDKPITSYSQLNSRKELDLLMIENLEMFDNPISFGDKNSGKVSSMVIFEFKRPGDVAHQKRKTDYRWEFSELVEPYFEEFIYSEVKKNYKGNQVLLEQNTPKFGFIILDQIPNSLASYNINKGWKMAPFGTYFKMQPEINLHIEVMTFRKLLEFAHNRHSPFFDKLFV